MSNAALRGGVVTPELFKKTHTITPEMIDEEIKEAARIGACGDCKAIIYDDEPFERVGSQAIGTVSVGVFRCAPCSLAKRGLRVSPSTRPVEEHPSEQATPIEEA